MNTLMIPASQNRYVTTVLAFVGIEDIAPVLSVVSMFQKAREEIMAGRDGARNTQQRNEI